MKKNTNTRKSKRDRNKPNFILTFSKEPSTQTQKDELLAEFVYTLLRWQQNEL